MDEQSAGDTTTRHDQETILRYERRGRRHVLIVSHEDGDAPALAAGQRYARGKLTRGNEDEWRDTRLLEEYLGR